MSSSPISRDKGRGEKYPPPIKVMSTNEKLLREFDEIKDPKLLGRSSFDFSSKEMLRTHNIFFNNGGLNPFSNSKSRDKPDQWHF